MWAKERLGAHLWSKQREIGESVVAHRRTAVRSAHATGKTFNAAVLTAWWLDTHDNALVISTAPSHDQVHGQLWEEVRRLHRKARLPGEVQRSDQWLSAAGELIGVGRRPPDHSESSFQGYHRRYVLVILDEAGGIPAWLWTAAESVTTGADCRILAIGNPDDNSSTFATVCGDPGWHSIRISAYDSPNLTGEDVPNELRHVLVSREWVEDKRDRWGETNPLYISKVLGEFADSEDGLIPLSWVAAAQQRWRDWADAGRPDQPGPKIVGVDVARFGTDKTCLAIRRGDVIPSVTRYAKLDTTQVTSLVAAELAEHSQARAIVDDIGVGGGVVDQLRAARRPVVPFTASAATGRRDVTGSWSFPNVRSAAWWHMRELLDPALGATIALPLDDELAAELTAPQWEPAAGSKIVVESKDSMKKRLGRSTDTADAVVQAFWHGPTPQLDHLGRAKPSVTRRPHRAAQGNISDWTPRGYQAAGGYTNHGHHAVPTVQP
jgi:hypothetical protein